MTREEAFWTAFVAALCRIPPRHTKAGVTPCRLLTPGSVPLALLWGIAP